MPTHELLRWVEKHLIYVLDHIPTKEEIADGYDASIVLAMDIFTKAAQHYGGLIEHGNALRYTLTKAQDMWEHACSFVAKHGELVNEITLNPMGLLITVSVSANMANDENLSNAFSKEIYEIIAERGERLQTVPTPGQDTMTNDEIEKILENADENIVKEFFETFRQVKVFYNDPKKYENEEDLKLHNKMLAIFSRIIRSAENKS